ncbi:MAG: endonuclease/exonuclease/phosphatase family protein [Thermoanaerobaculia bacterium]
MLLLISACATVRERQAASVDITILTWNILHGANDEGELNLEAKGRYISKQAADLVFLQEVDEKCERSGGVDQIAVLGRISAMDVAFGSFMPYQGGRYGLGTLSSLPVRATRSLKLPEGDEPRVALLREVEVLGRPLLTVNVHFNWTQDDTFRYAQARALLGELETLELPMIVAGDFNDTPDSRTMKAFFATGFESVEAPGPSWNALAPSRDIDHILVRSGRGLQLEPLGGEVLEERALSDHRPVRGRIRLQVSDLQPLR